ncbi:MAG: helix-turn-helix domain-containing protein [Armatimonadetes bacterium]|nr:helix-turn-helix domain-containing protein [Armatimonadota bacterium]
MLLGLLDELLGNRVKVGILRLLCTHRRQFTGREVARALGRAPATTHEALQALVASGVLEQETRPPVVLYRLAQGNPWVARVLRPLFSAEEGTEAALAREITEAAGEAAESVVLFGSRARGTSRPGSDLDVLFVVRSRRSTARIAAALGDVSLRWGLSIEPLFVGLSEFPRWSQAAPDVWAGILSHGLTLRGTPPSELVRHARRSPTATG